MKDKTFSDKDLIRIYCNNLSDYERVVVQKWFKKYKGGCDGVINDDEDKKRLKDNNKLLESATDIIKDSMSNLKTLGAFLVGYLLGGNGEEESSLEKDINSSVIKRDVERDADITDSVVNVAMLTVYDVLEKTNIRITRREQARLRQEAREKFRIEMLRIDETFKLYPYLSYDMQNNIKDWALGLSNVYDNVSDTIEVLEGIKIDTDNYINGVFGIDEEVN